MLIFVKPLRFTKQKASFAILNGETAELGSGENLLPDQSIVAIREPSPRTNGFTKIREILEAGIILDEPVIEFHGYRWNY